MTNKQTGYDVTDAQKKNSDKQARWRERHIIKRRYAQRIVNILVRQSLTEDHIKQVARLLTEFLNREGVRTLRRALKPITNAENAARHRAAEKMVRDLWLREHPGRTAAGCRRLYRTEEMWEWGRAKGQASTAAERAAWERDHPGKEWPEHPCGLTDRESTDYERWLRKYQRSMTTTRMTTNGTTSQ